MFAPKSIRSQTKATKQPSPEVAQRSPPDTQQSSRKSSTEIPLDPRSSHDFTNVRIHSGSNAAAPERSDLPHTSAMQPGTLQSGARWSRLFGTDLSAVRFHPESPRAGGRIHALTEGDHVYFASGRFAPGTSHGDRLIAHELAHVTQQRHPPGPPSPPLAAELDADAAAEAAIRGESVRTRASLAAGRAYSYEAWEHRQLGDALGGENRRIRLPNGVELTYGQIVALSGDFYRSPEALLRAPRAELNEILSVMARERALATASSTHAPSAADADKINASYELATTGPGRIGSPGPTLVGASGPHGEVREGEHVESGAPGGEASFLDLASANPAHFSPENISLNWIPKHRLALDLARMPARPRRQSSRAVTQAPALALQPPAPRGQPNFPLPARQLPPSEPRVPIRRQHLQQGAWRAPLQRRRRPSRTKPRHG
jgi:hypothetical protein